MKALFVLACSILLQSCIILTPVMQYSVDQNVPLISEKGEGQISVSTGTEMIGIQGAYGITNSISAMGNFSDGINAIYLDGDGEGITAIDNGLRQSGELAVGYHYSISPHILFEIYGGAERYYRSYSYSVYNQYADTFSTNITKPFIQLDLGILDNKKNGLGLSCKFGELIFDHYSDKLTGTYYMYGNSLYQPIGYSTRLIIEPCITYRVGGRDISCQMQFGATFTPTGNGFPLGITDMFVSIGVQARFYDFLKREKNKK